MVKNIGIEILLIYICCLAFLLSNNMCYSQNSKNKIFICKATYYHDRFENRRTSSGEVFSQKLFTAAHKTLPLQTIIKVTNKRTGKNVLLKINDRCGRAGILDMSKSAAKTIGLNGSEQVQIEVLGKDYSDVWLKQKEYIDNNIEDSIRNYYIDSLIADCSLKIDYSYYVRLLTVESVNEAELILKDLDENFNQKAKMEKVYNENFYYINIGPFSSNESANLVINKLKKKYPFAHLIKNK